jgi:O-6-methylguanine DNA methyltransferase
MECRLLRAGGCKIRLVFKNGNLRLVHLPKAVPPGFDAGALKEIVAHLTALQWAIDAATPFRRLVWRRLLQIPRGRMMTYGELAAAVGNPGAARAVGGALGANPLPLIVPCHRVVAQNGLGGFSAGQAWKRRLLELEGAVPP